MITRTSPRLYFVALWIISISQTTIHANAEDDVDDVDDDANAADASSLLNLALTVAVLTTCYFFLRMLMFMAKLTLEQQVVSITPDPFRNMAMGQNWSWDFVMVFPIHTEAAPGEQGRKKNVEFLSENTLRNVIEKLNGGRLETKCFYSRDRDVIFVKIRASRARLEDEADRTNYLLKLSEKEIQKRMAEGAKDLEGNYIWHPRAYNEEITKNMEDDEWCKKHYVKGSSLRHRLEYVTFRDEDEEYALKSEEEKPILSRIYPILDQEQQTDIPYYRFIFGDFQKGGDKIALYEIDFRTNSQFRAVDRLRLMQTIFEARISEGGCGLNPRKMVTEGCILACFPLHNEDDLIQMNSKLFGENVNWRLLIHDMHKECTDIKNYYGEKIGLYFTFLCLYNRWLLYASIPGLVVWLANECMSQSISSEPGAADPISNSILTPYLCIFLSIWSTLFLESWKNRQIRTSMEWGTTNFENEEVERPEFQASEDVIEMNSPITGEPVFYFPPDEQSKRINRSILTISGLMCVVFIMVFGIFFFKAWTSEPGSIFNLVLELGGTEYEVKTGSIIAGFANAVLITIMNMVYDSVKCKLNDAENWSTNTEYEDALILKTFIFKFANSYSALFYIAFVKQFIIVQFMMGGTMDGAQPEGTMNYGNHECTDQDCMYELAQQLFSIFVVRIAVSNGTEILLPYLKHKAMGKDDAEKSFDDAELVYENPEDPDGGMKRMRSAVEVEFDLEEYDIMMGPFEDYIEMVLQFGYATLFTAAYPIAPLLSFANNYVELRLDAWHLAAANRRATPSGAQDIGSWEVILSTMGTLAVISNCGLLCFTGSYLCSRHQFRDENFDGIRQSNVNVTEDRYFTYYFNSFQEHYPCVPMSPVDKFLVFLFIEHGLLILKFIIELAIPDVPDDVQIQIERGEFLTSKILSNASDELEQPIERDPIKDQAALVMYEEDEDSVLKTHEKNRMKVLAKKKARDGEFPEEMKM